ncbi:MAG: hypothetical protein EHM85_13730 [Desulfobacteraceae bacterium]|nr:MAG: hypothetical protein EHM85_13730 [Desulfobacteraceae bacterium]
METFAVYWEPIIKTYGIAERTGLCLVTLDLPFHRISDAGDWLIRFASRFDGSLVMIFSRPATPAGLKFHLLLDKSPEKIEPDKIAAAEKNSQSDQSMEMNPAAFERAFPVLQIDNPVELVYFQGPHYGDRYGIAGAAMRALAEKKVPLLAVVCTGASVYLITPTGKAREARKALGQAFSTPETCKSESET